MKVASILLAATILAVSPATSDAASSVKYKNQKAGQFCKKTDVGKFVLSPSAGRLKCLIAKGSDRARWSRG